MNKLQKQVIESCIDTRDVFDSKKLSTKSYSDEMERRRQEEQLIMEARIRNIKKNYQSKYESLHQTYLYQCEQLKQQLQSEIKKEMYSFEKKMENYLKSISEHDKKLYKSGLSQGLFNYSSYCEQSNHIAQTLQTEQTLNQSSVNELFNFVESHDNSLFHKKSQNSTSPPLKNQSSVATFNNQPNSYRAFEGNSLINNNALQVTRILLSDDECNDNSSKISHFNNRVSNKENLFDQNISCYTKNFKNKSILKGSQQNQQNFQSYEQFSPIKIHSEQASRVLTSNQNRQNVEAYLQQNLKQKNWDTIKQIRQQLRDKSSSPNNSFATNHRTEKCSSTNSYRKSSQMIKNKENTIQNTQNNRLNRSFQINNNQDSYLTKNTNSSNVNPYHNLSFTNLNEFNCENYQQQRINLNTSSDSDSDTHLDTDRLKRFKIDNINLIKTLKNNNNKKTRTTNNSYYK